jgi:hypothetical protein
MIDEDEGEVEDEVDLNCYHKLQKKLKIFKIFKVTCDHFVRKLWKIKFFFVQCLTLIFISIISIHHI